MDFIKFNICKEKNEPSIRTRLTTRFDKTSFKKAITQITKNYIKLQKAMNKDSFEDKDHEDYSKACKIAQRKLVSHRYLTWNDLKQYFLTSNDLWTETTEILEPKSATIQCKSEGCLLCICLGWRMVPKR